MQSEGVSYIGYAEGVYDGAGNRCGLIVMLIEEEKTLELIASVVPDDSLLVAMTASGETVIANTPVFPQAKAGLLARRHIGVTPFEILVAADEGSLNESNRYFSIAAAITAIMFCALIVLIARLLNKQFFSPMLRVMDSVEALDETAEGHQLPPAQSAEFDSLIGKINDMLGRLERRGKEVQLSELRAINAELEKQRAIVFSLKKQINTHFLINTLNQVLNRVGTGDAEDAVTMLKDLSSIVQYAFDERDYVLVWDEFETLDRYLAIMNIRYDKRIEWDMDIDDSLMDEAMPRMLVQPIVENAAFHGLKNRDSIRIDIAMRREGDSFVITVRDNWQGMDAEALAALRAKLAAPTEAAPDKMKNIALVNVKKRLTSYYSGGGTLRIDSAEGAGTKVVLAFPAGSR
jgi:two-component system sensor histidine kinase YesM